MSLCITTDLVKFLKVQQDLIPVEERLLQTRRTRGERRRPSLLSVMSCYADSDDILSVSRLHCHQFIVASASFSISFRPPQDRRIAAHPRDYHRHGDTKEIHRRDNAVSEEAPSAPREQKLWEPPKTDDKRSTTKRQTRESSSSNVSEKRSYQQKSTRNDRLADIGVFQ